MNEETMMEARFELLDNPIGLAAVKHLIAAGKTVEGSTLPKATQELVKIRASQINNCGYCTDMHTKDATAAGETADRLNLVAVWREAVHFTEAERAALAFTEEGTRLADASFGVGDETWKQVRKHYDDDQIAALVALLAVINAFNRLNVSLHAPGGTYRPGQWD